MQTNNMLIFLLGNQYLTQTDTELNYNQAQIIPRDQQLVFGVKAATDVRLALSYTPGNHTHGTYEIIIGGGNNTQLIIRDVETVSIILTLNSPYLSCFNK